MLKSSEVMANVDTTCQKDTGEKSRIQLWSRGNFFYCKTLWSHRSMEAPVPVIVIVICANTLLCKNLQI